MDSPTQFLPLLQQGHEEGGYPVGMAGILTGSSFLHYSILGIGPPVFCFPVYGKMRFVVNDEIRPGAGIPAGILKFL